MNAFARSPVPTTIATELHAGGPCSCAPGRYVRWIDPRGVPGLEPAVHCRGYDSPADDRRTHSLPSHVAVLVRCPDLDPARVR